MNDGVLVRSATPADVPDIERIVRAAYSPYLARIGREPAPMTVDYRAVVTTTDHAHVLVDDDQVTGVLVVVVGADHVFVDNVAVGPDAQGRGHGRTLLAYAEQVAREHRRPEMRLYTNAAMTENLAMYPRLGYTEVDRQREDGFDRVYFVKNVRGPLP